MVSVIIPAYNAEKYIGECLQSVIEQTYSDIEIIVVNDGSVDDTEAIVEKFCRLDSRIKLITTENKGVSAARNTALDNCSNDDGFLFFLDADDRIFPTTIEDLKYYLDTYDADIVDGYTLSAEFGERKEKPIIKEKQMKIWEGETTLKMCLFDAPQITSCSAKLYRKSIAKGVRFAEDIRLHEDRFFTFMCALNQPKFVVTNEIVYQYNVIAGSASRSGFSEKCFDILKVAERQSQIVSERYPHLSERLYNTKIKANMTILHFLVSNFDKQYKKIEKQCLREIKKNQKYFKPSRKRDKEWFNVIKNNLYYFVKFKKWIKLIIRK